MTKLQKKIFGLIGIAKKSHNLVSGEFSTEKTVKNRDAFLVIIAEDASDNTKKKFKNMCTYYEVPIYFFGNKTQLGHAIGKSFRASLAVLDNGIASTIEEQLKMIQEN